MQPTKRLKLRGDVGKWIEVGGATLDVGHTTWVITRIHFNISLRGYLRAHGETSAGRVWIPLEDPPHWLASLISEVKTSHDNTQISQSAGL